jgi:hypothetical protein
MADEIPPVPDGETPPVAPRVPRITFAATEIVAGVVVVRIFYQ